MDLNLEVQFWTTIISSGVVLLGIVAGTLVNIYNLERQKKDTLHAIKSQITDESIRDWIHEFRNAVIELINHLESLRYFLLNIKDGGLEINTKGLLFQYSKIRFLLGDRQELDIKILNKIENISDYMRKYYNSIIAEIKVTGDENIQVDKDRDSHIELNELRNELINLCHEKVQSKWMVLKEDD